VFLDYKLPEGEMRHRGTPVDPSKVKRVALMTVEGEKDDISGIGQTEAAQTLCSKLSDGLRAHHLQPGVGHYGVFNGSRFRSDILPEIRRFIRAHQRRKSALGRALSRVA
jgi:poly(3-hydroxybutyrate) depolymerase